MTLENQRELLVTLAEVWTLSPDVRLGQLMAHLGFLGEAHLGRGLGDIDDDELLAILFRHRAELIARTQTQPTAGPPAPSAAVSLSGSAIPASPPSADTAH
jgi:hypothetical protein